MDRKEKLEQELTRIVDAIDKEKVSAIILFGSLARGEVGPTSDIDLIVVKETDQHFLDRMDVVYRQAAPRMALDLLVYSPAELAEMKQWSGFVRHALREGKILYAA